MKRLTKFSIGLLLAAFTMTGCENMFDVDSERVLFQDDHQLDSPKDTIFTMFGILSQFQKLADRYVVLGELRGDLMDVTDHSNLDLLQVNNFTMTPEHPYANIKDYYTVINNCNYLISHIDTSLVDKAEKVMLKEFAAAKSIRAWTYLQLVLNYGSAKYYTNPILTVEDANKNYPEVDLDALADLLITDLEPIKTIPLPGYINLVFIPTRVLLGDLYLWRKNYEQAAAEYRDFLYENEIVVEKDRQSYYVVTGSAFGKKEREWNLTFNSVQSSDHLSLFYYTTYQGKLATLDSLMLATYELAPSAVAIDNWKNQVYYHDNIYSIMGDLRGENASWCYREALSGSELESTDLAKRVSDAVDGPIAFKISNLSGEVDAVIPIYRSATVYLRYAEAVNRAGKPNLAFAVLKNGLNIVSLNTSSIVPKSEIGVPRPAYMNFDDVRFRDNIGIHARGCGYTEKATAYKIPSLLSAEDSIELVEDWIMDEYALETAFEGNRFHDLMRVALRRDDNEYLAKKIDAKHGGNKGDIYNKLLDRTNWYLPKK